MGSARPYLLALLGAYALSFSALAEEGFFRVSDLRDHPDGPAIQKAATRTVRFLWNAADYTKKELIQRKHFGASCSGLFLSDDGYLLVASHCIKRALINEPLSWFIGVTKKTINAKPDANGFPKYTSWYEIENQAPDGAILENAAVLFPQGGFHRGRAEIVALGSGFSAIQNTSTADPKIAKTYTMDFAILKFELKSKPRCVQIDPAAKLTDRVYLVGYPKKIERTGTRSSDGVSQYFTQGDLLSSVSKIKQYSQETPEAISHLDAVYASDIALATNADGTPGMSGGMMINQMGQMIGMTTRGFFTEEIPTGKEQLTSALSTVAIHDEVVRVLGHERARKIFSCKEK